ncbi:hypothetical protein [Pseudoalteromonas byunsanensis]|uniref:Uncharacterized protein n=1 Tax=Pseudoalteromonas byunsanensis TaxID=327939 RepID=A0A1S1N6Z7_9GAMM|nr:hypothetical protein [Pseudoalteromonas byunsanensis]OHU94432.1 hypothetical protein BIW53_15265 [Pseudoalteromonas byunsanensis]
MNYYANKLTYICLLFSLVFLVTFDLILTPFFGSGINYQDSSELLTISMPFLFNCAGALCLAMFLAGSLKASKRRYRQYMNICSMSIVVYSLVVSTIFAFGLRDKITGFSLDGFWYDYAPLSSLYLNFLLIILLYWVFRFSAPNEK